MPETVQIEIDRPAAELPAEGEQVQRRKIAGGIVEEHILRTGVRGIDASVADAGLPVVDGRVELKAGIGRSPGRYRDPAHETPGLHPADERPLGTPEQGPVATPLY